MFSVTFIQQTPFSWDILNETGAVIGTLKVLPNITTVKVRNMSRAIQGDDITLGQAIAVGLAYFTRED